MMQVSNEESYREEVEAILNDLRGLANSEFAAGMKKFAVGDDSALGIKIPALESYAKKIGKCQQLSLRLWEERIHEAKLLAVLIGEPAAVNDYQMEEWVKDFYSWDICDQACGRLFGQHPAAYEKAACGRGEKESSKSAQALL